MTFTHTFINCIQLYLYHTIFTHILQISVCFIFFLIFKLNIIFVDYYVCTCWRRWRRIGHVLRKNQQDLTKTALFWTPEGKRRRGRPRITWRHTVEAEMNELNHSWESQQKMAKDRQKWRTFVAAPHAIWRNGQ